MSYHKHALVIPTHLKGPFHGEALEAKDSLQRNHKGVPLAAQSATLCFRKRGGMAGWLVTYIERSLTPSMGVTKTCSPGDILELSGLTDPKAKGLTHLTCSSRQLARKS